VFAAHTASRVAPLLEITTSSLPGRAFRNAVGLLFHGLGARVGGGRCAFYPSEDGISRVFAAHTASRVAPLLEITIIFRAFRNAVDVLFHGLSGHSTGLAAINNKTIQAVCDVCSW